MMRFSFSVLFVSVLLTLGVSAQNFFPADYILDQASVARVTKSHIPNDSVILNSTSLPIDVDDPDLQRLISSMYKTVTDSMSLGVGIAAPQVGVNKRIVLVQRFDKPNEPFEAYLNPVIVQHSVLTETRSEGCLSVDDYRCEVERPYAILVNYFSVDGTFRIEMVEGFTARIFQHEIDHLDGVLFMEREKK